MHDFVMDPDGLISQAVQQISGHDFDRAQRLLEDSVAARPNYALGVLNLAVVHFLKNDFPRAERLFLEAIEIDPASVPAALGLAKLCLVQRRYDAAREALNRVDPDPRDAHRAEFDHLSGIVHASNMDWEQAIRSFRRYAEAMPEHVDPWVCLHKAYVGCGDSSSAIDMLEQVVERAPNDAQAWIRLAAMIFESGDTQRLIATCRRMLDALPDDPVLHNLAAHFAIKSGCYAYAYQFYQHAVRAKPDLDLKPFAALARIAAVVP